MSGSTAVGCCAELVDPRPQMVEWLVGVPSFLHDTLQSFRQREDMKVALEHHGNLEQFEEKGTPLKDHADASTQS